MVIAQHAKCTERHGTVCFTVNFMLCELHINKQKERKGKRLLHRNSYRDAKIYVPQHRGGPRAGIGNVHPEQGRPPRPAQRQSQDAAEAQRGGPRLVLARVPGVWVWTHGPAQRGRHCTRVLLTLPTVRVFHSLTRDTALTEHPLYPCGPV